MTAKTQDWKTMRDMAGRLLKERTGEDTAAWNQRINFEHFNDEKSLREWLSKQGVLSYPQSLLVWECFGYPDYMIATADALIDQQYADQPQLRMIFDALVNAAESFGEVIIQARKTYVALVTSRRTFARIQPATRERVYLALRLEGQIPGGRLQPSRVHETTPLQITLSSAEEVDAEVIGWLQKAYDQSA